MTHHFQAVVSEKVLQREHVSPVAEIIDRKGVAELVRMGLDPQPLSELCNE
jgi:hypothetical protein